MPQLIVGTLGGGTGQATKREFREMLRCRGTGRADELAEICTGVAY